MRDYDRLPQELRMWLASASLPWAPRSVLRAYDKAIAKTSDKDRALHELNRLQESLLKRDAVKVWGQNHPGAPRRAAP